MKNNNNVKTYSSNVYLNVDDLNHLAFDIANNSKSIRNGCEVDDILCLLGENTNENDNEDMADESARNDDDFVFNLNHNNDVKHCLSHTRLNVVDFNDVLYDASNVINYQHGIKTI